MKRPCEPVGAALQPASMRVTSPLHNGTRSCTRRLDGNNLRRSRLEVNMHEHPIAIWHRLVRTHDAAGLNDLLAEEAVFHSPVVHTPQRGRAVTALYLGAAFQVFFGDRFRYVREIVGTSDAMLEFETEIDGVAVNGVDLITWNAAGQIVDFKVMIRPLKAINVIHQRMAAMLETLKNPR
jgi:hypothetical protein